MCQGFGPKKHDEISEIDRMLFYAMLSDDRLTTQESLRQALLVALFQRGDANPGAARIG